MNTISVKFRLKLTLDEIKIFSKAGLGSEKERDGEGERKRKQEKGRGRWVSSLASREERERERERIKERKECPNFKGGIYLVPTLMKLGERKKKRMGETAV